MTNPEYQKSMIEEETFKKLIDMNERYLIEKSMKWFIQLKCQMYPRHPSIPIKCHQRQDPPSTRSDLDTPRVTISKSVK